MSTDMSTTTLQNKLLSEFSKSITIIIIFNFNCCKALYV